MSSLVVFSFSFVPTMAYYRLLLIYLELMPKIEREKERMRAPFVSTAFMTFIHHISLRVLCRRYSLESLCWSTVPRGHTVKCCNKNRRCRPTSSPNSSLGSWLHDGTKEPPNPRVIAPAKACSL